MDSNREPLISVVMPVYNCEAYVHDAVESVLSQTFSDFELLIVDDFSTDKTLDVISEFEDSRIHIVHKSANSGITDSLNLGIEKARGRYIARMDGDDICELNRFKVQFDFLENHPDIGLVGSWYTIIDTGELSTIPEAHEDIMIAMLEYCPLAHPTIFIRKSILDAHQLYYKSRFELAEDYELWTRMSAVTRLANMPEALLKYRRHAQQSSAKKAILQQSISSEVRLQMLQRLSPHFHMDLNTSVLKKYIDEKVTGFAQFIALLRAIELLQLANLQKIIFHPLKFELFLSHKQELMLRAYFHKLSFSGRFYAKLKLLFLFIFNNRLFLFGVKRFLKLLVK